MALILNLNSMHTLWYWKIWSSLIKPAIYGKEKILRKPLKSSWYFQLRWFERDKLSFWKCTLFAGSRLESISYAKWNVGRLQAKSIRALCWNNSKTVEDTCKSSCGNKSIWQGQLTQLWEVSKTVRTVTFWLSERIKSQERQMPMSIFLCTWYCHGTSCLDSLMCLLVTKVNPTMCIHVHACYVATSDP